MIYIFTMMFIFFDFLTGVLKAIALKKMKSSVMRKGLWHKVGSILCMTFGALLQATTNFIDIGINIQVAYGICAYIIIMEITSINENLKAINPDLSIEKLLNIIKGGKK